MHSTFFLHDFSCMHSIVVYMFKLAREERLRRRRELERTQRPSETPEQHEIPLNAGRERDRTRHAAMRTDQREAIGYRGVPPENNSGGLLKAM